MAMKLKELTDCYQQLQSRLQNYATLKTKLDNKGDEVRKEISRQVSEESQLLRAREKQLLGQVDVAAAHFMSVYLAHHAHLHQLVGLAQNFLSKNTVDEETPGNNKNLETEAQDICERIRSGLKFCDLDVTADLEEHISVSFTQKAVDELERCIMDFGQVGNGKIFHLRAPGSDEDNKTGFGFLPYGHEDYLDNDIEVLQSKPLLGTPSVVRFPKRIIGVPRRQIGLTPEERQRWLYNPAADKNLLKVKPTNDGVCWLKKDDEEKKRSGSSSFSESIEVLGNTDDDDDPNWTEDDEFLLLKTFCKRSPICDQIGGCCGGDKGDNCVKRALEKPMSVPAASSVNINYVNRSVASRSVSWLMKEGSVKNAEAGEATNKGLVEWRKIIAKQWEKTWKADNETWLIRKRRIMEQNVEKEEMKKEEIESTAPDLPKKPLFERLEMKNKTWIIKQTSDEKHESSAAERIFAKPTALKPEELSKWRLSGVSSDDKGDCAAIFSEMRAKKAEGCVWVSANEKTRGKGAVLNGNSSSAINYKAWLAPERNCSPHSEKFLSGTANGEKLFMMKNLFTTGRTVKSDASWLAPKDGTV